MPAEGIAIGVARPGSEHVTASGLGHQRLGCVHVHGQLGHRPQRDSAGGGGAQPQAVGVERQQHHGLGLKQRVGLLGGAFQHA